MIGAPTTVFVAESYTPSPDPLISVPVAKRLGSASGRGLETLPTVSEHVVLTTVNAN